MKVKMLTGLILIDAQLSALNNAGIDPTQRERNKMLVKKIRVRGNEYYPYASGQAFKRWWRDTILEKFGWIPSPITREEKAAYTQGDPIVYEEDDVFGYMVTLAKGEEGKGLVYRRVAPLKSTPLISVFPQVISSDFGIFARGETAAQPIPYEQEAYSTVLKGTFSVMLNQVGAFQLGRGKDLPSPTEADELRKKKISKDRIEELERISAKLLEEAKTRGASITSDSITLPENERKKRIAETVTALGELTGGAKISDYLTDLTPKFIIAAVLSVANHIFMDVVKASDGSTTVDSDILGEVVHDYHDRLLSPVFIGLRKGFFEDKEYDRMSAMQELPLKTSQGADKLDVKFGTPKQTIEAIADFAKKMEL